MAKLLLVVFVGHAWVFSMVTGHGPVSSVYVSKVGHCSKLRTLHSFRVFKFGFVYLIFPFSVSDDARRTLRRNHTYQRTALLAMGSHSRGRILVVVIVSVPLLG